MRLVNYFFAAFLFLFSQVTFAQSQCHSLFTTQNVLLNGVIDYFKGEGKIRNPRASEIFERDLFQMRGVQTRPGQINPIGRLEIAHKLAAEPYFIESAYFAIKEAIINSTHFKRDYLQQDTAAEVFDFNIINSMSRMIKTPEAADKYAALWITVIKNVDLQPAFFVSSILEIETSGRFIINVGSLFTKNVSADGVALYMSRYFGYDSYYKLNHDKSIFAVR
jgi:hypothetical protein